MLQNLPISQPLESPGTNALTKLILLQHLRYTRMKRNPSSTINIILFSLTECFSHSSIHRISVTASISRARISAAEDLKSRWTQTVEKQQLMSVIRHVDLKAPVAVVVGADFKLQMEVESICSSLILHCMVRKKKKVMTAHIFLPTLRLKRTCWENSHEINRERNSGWNDATTCNFKRYVVIQKTHFMSLFWGKYMFDKIVVIEDVRMLLIY